MVSFAYYSHTTPIRIPKDMGMVWVPLTIRGSHYWGSLKFPLNQPFKTGCLGSFRTISLRHFVAGEGSSQQVPENGGLLSHQGPFTLAGPLGNGVCDCVCVSRILNECFLGNGALIFCICFKDVFVLKEMFEGAI